MFLNQVHYLWRELGKADTLKAILLVAAPLAAFALLAVLLKAAG
jgi:hypothetical protein